MSHNKRNYLSGQGVNTPVQQDAYAEEYLSVHSETGAIAARWLPDQLGVILKLRLICFYTC